MDNKIFEFEFEYSDYANVRQSNALHVQIRWFAQSNMDGEGWGREKQKGAPAIRVGVFVFHPPFSELIR